MAKKNKDKIVELFEFMNSDYPVQNAYQKYGNGYEDLMEFFRLSKNLDISKVSKRGTKLMENGKVIYDEEYNEVGRSYVVDYFNIDELPHFIIFEVLTIDEIPENLNHYETISDVPQLPSQLTSISIWDTIYYQGRKKNMRLQIQSVQSDYNYKYEE